MEHRHVELAQRGRPERGEIDERLEREPGRPRLAGHAHREHDARGPLAPEPRLDRRRRRLVAVDDVEGRARRRAQRREVEVGQIPDQPMRRQHQQPRILGARQEHHREVGRRAPRRVVERAQLGAEPQHRLVAVVAVGDQDLLVGEQAHQARDRRRLAQPPEAMPDAVGGRGVERRLRRRRAVDELARGAVGVAVEAEDRRDLRVGRPQQLEAILLRPRQRLLVRQHHPPLERLEPHGREEPAPREDPARRLRQRELLLVDVERRLASARSAPSAIQSPSRRAASA